MNRDSIADLLGFSRRTTFYKEKRAYAYDFPLEAFQSGRRGWTGGDADSDSGHETEIAEEQADESDDNEGDASEVRLAADPEDTVTAAKLLDDVEDVAEEVANADEDSSPETHLERAISALQAAKSAL